MEKVGEGETFMLTDVHGRDDQAHDSPRSDSPTSEQSYAIKWQSMHLSSGVSVARG
jgi:hypothetical protein